MQRYYLVAKKVTQLNIILLQNIAVRQQPPASLSGRPLNERFQAQGNLLDILDEHVFINHPHALLECFLIMQRHAELQGMTARTLRALWRRSASSSTLPSEQTHTTATISFNCSRSHEGKHTNSGALNQYGILGAYIPAFGRIEGQMQHDLFHVYTVDPTHSASTQECEAPGHGRNMLMNIRLMTRLITGFERHWLLYVAAPLS